MDQILERLLSLVEAARYRAVLDGNLDPRFVDGVLVPQVESLLAETFQQIDYMHTLRGDVANRVIHYTRLDTIVAMLGRAAKQQDAFLRLNDSSSFNDPDEGQFFTGNLALPSKHRWVMEGSTSHAYVASFIIPDDKLDLSDDLMFWRTYGREGEGCSLVLSAPSKGCGQSYTVFNTLGKLEQFYCLS